MVTGPRLAPGWLAAPLGALLVMGVAGWMGALADTTSASLGLARDSSSAPIITREAAVEVRDLPAIADLTGRQADAFVVLAEALDSSATRVLALNDSLSGQVQGVDELAIALGGVLDALPCISERLDEMIAATESSPQTLRAIAGTLDDIAVQQRRALHHLRNINRKLTALGVVATATGVEPPARQGPVPFPEPGPAADPIDC